MKHNQEKLTKIKYKNWKGETSDYTILPIEISFKSTEYHPEEQWVLYAAKQQDDGSFVSRHFAMKDILAWWQ